MIAVAGTQSECSVRLRRVPDCAVVQARSAVEAMAKRSPRPRPERLSGIHNPWGHAATLTNAWAFLDLCESTMVLDQIRFTIGQDVILWDSELYLRGVEYISFVAERREGRYWPIAPLVGAIALISFASPAILYVADVKTLMAGDLSGIDPAAPLYVIRYMPASSRFIRDPRFPANWAAMEEQPLINFTSRPLWLVCGEDRAGNDFVTGFASNAPRWAGQ